MCVAVGMQVAQVKIHAITVQNFFTLIMMTLGRHYYGQHRQQHNEKGSAVRHVFGGNMLYILQFTELIKSLR